MKHEHLFYEGYQYTHHKTTSYGHLFRCTQKRSLACNAIARTNSQREGIRLEYQHSHPPDHHKQKRMAVQSEIKKEASVSLAAPSQILDKHIQGVDPQVLAGLPLKKSIFKSVQRERPAPVDPAKRTDFVDIEERFKTTDLKELFLQHDTGHEDPNRILVFSTASLLTLLATAITIFCDGTFKISPLSFEQVYVFRICKDGVYITALYGLLPNKRKSTYKRFFKAVWRLCGGSMSVRRILMDFEVAAVNSAIGVFGFGRELIVSGCWFHLKQSMKRKRHSLRLDEAYRTNKKFRYLCLMIEGLAFLPLDKIAEGKFFLYCFHKIPSFSFTYG